MTKEDLETSLELEENGDNVREGKREKREHSIHSFEAKQVPRKVKPPTNSH